MTEPQRGPCPQRSVRGLSVSSPVATVHGWLSAGDLRPGILLPGAAAAPQPVVAVYLRPPAADADPAFWPVLLPAQAFGNPRAVWLQPGQPVLLDCDLGLDLLAEPCPVVPAQALTGWRGIASHPHPQPMVSLLFAQPHLIYAGGGLILGCDGVSCAAPALGLAQSRHLVACLVAEEVGQALRHQAALRSAKRA